MELVIPVNLLDHSFSKYGKTSPISNLTGAIGDYTWLTGPHGTALARARSGTARLGTALCGTVAKPCRA